MGNRKVRQSIASLYQRIQEHQAKIAREQMNSQPDYGVIKHWQSEIQAFAMQVRHLEERLIQRRRRGR